MQQLLQQLLKEQQQEPPWWAKSKTLILFTQKTNSTQLKESLCQISLGIPEDQYQLEHANEPRTSQLLRGQKPTTAAVATLILNDIGQTKTQPYKVRKEKKHTQVRMQ